MRIHQTGARARGLFTINGSAIELSGDVLKDGTLQLTGNAPFATESAKDFDVAINVTRFAIRVAPATGLAGSVVYEMRSNKENSEYSGLAMLGGEIVNASRRDLSAFTSTVDGTWKGRFVVRSCVPIGPVCEWYGVDEFGDIELQLTQSGTQVSGIAKLLGDVPVTGQVSGRAIEIAGEGLAPASGGSSLTRITAWHASTDDFGRMSGQLEYLYAWPAAAPVFGSTARAELWQVVKVP